jgi:Uma2 family endonuclease
VSAYTVVEIRSPSTALVDLNMKKSAYERFGVPLYWIVDPGPPQPELTVFDLAYFPTRKSASR